MRKNKPDYNYKLAVRGMHCPACELTIEKCFRKVPEVTAVDARLMDEKVYFNLARKANLEKVIDKVNELLTDTGYVVLKENGKIMHSVNWMSLLQAGFISFIIIGLFLLLERVGIVNILNTNEVNLPFILFTGIIASLSSCMAIVGGLVLSFSSNLAQHSHIEKAKPLAIFHLSRIVGFFFLGGLIGVAGGIFALSQTATFLMNAALFLVMLVVGINLLNIFPWAKKLQLRMPKTFAKKALTVENQRTNLTALFLGVISFFLPCGFTQAAQFTALSTGDFLQGALTMLVFSLGTFPMLGLISFASIKFSIGLQSDLFFKVAGLLVIFFAFINLRGALIAMGVV